MNKFRRKEIKELCERLSDIHNEIECIRAAEDDYFENMPESIQEGEKGDIAQEAINSLQDCMDQLDAMTAELAEVAA